MDSTSRGSVSLGRVFLGSLVLCVAIGVTQGVLLYQAMAAEGAVQSGGRLILWQVLLWGTWSPLTLAVWRLAERWPVSGLGRARAVLANVSGGVAIVLAHAILVTLATMTVPPMEWARNEPFLEGLLANLRNRSILDALVFVAILAVANWIAEVYRSRERTLASARLEADLARAELRALQLQLRPHFLFNALHTVAGLVREGQNARAVDALVSLSDLLRQVLDREQRLEVRLEEELELVRRYAEVQQARFGERLDIRIETPPELDGALVPNLVLLPLVENAVSHGVAKLRDGGRIDVRARGDDGRLRLTVFNEGPPAHPGGSGGIGLANTRARLDAMYGDAATLDVANHERGVSVTLDLPHRREPS